MDQKQLRRGAAGVSTVLMVSVIVMFFVAVGFALVSADEASSARSARDSALAEAAREAALASTQISKNTELSRVLGFYPPDAARPEANAQVAKEALDSLKPLFKDMGPTVDNFEKALPYVKSRVQQLQTQLAEAQQSVADLRANIAARDSQLRDVTSSKDTEISGLRTNLNDTEQAASNQQTQLQGQLAAARNEVSTRDRQVREAQTESERLERAKNSELSGKDSRIESLVQQLKVVVDEPETPDGSILEVSKELGLAWIDLGNKNRLALGTRFSVVDGTPGAERVKAWAEVVSVDHNMSQVRLFDIRDPFDPPVQGDVVYNPIYDPKSERYAILVGRFSGSYSESDLKALLAEMNIRVQDTRDLTTDYMIVGAELYYDEEGEPLEEPMPASETSAYKEAVAAGVQVVPLKDIRAYFSAR